MTRPTSDTRRLSLVLPLLLVLAACGGGNGGTPAPDGGKPPPPTTDGGGGPVPDGGGGPVPDGGPAPTACTTCASGYCLPDGTCVQCGTDAQCSGVTAHCNPPTHTCVACIPSTGEGCSPSQFCASDFVCVSGCRNNAGCKSGICLANHDCAYCESNAECSQGRQCGTGTCSATCAGDGDCTGGRKCCGGACIDLTRDIHHCGTCALNCNANQFCTGTACKSVALTNVCDNSAATVLLDGLSADNDAGYVLASALTSGCSPAPTVTVIPQQASQDIDAGSGRPLLGGGKLLVAAGGSFGQNLVDYVERSGISPIFDSSTNNSYSFSTRDGGGVALFYAPSSSLSASHDYFVVQLVREPVNGTLSLVSYGFDGPGTQASAWFFAHKVMVNRAAYPGSWYVVEWTNADGDPAPSAGDTYTVIGSGS